MQAVDNETEWEADVKEETDRLVKEEENALKDASSLVSGDASQEATARSVLSPQLTARTNPAIDTEFKKELRAFLAAKNVFCSSKWFKMVGEQLSNMKVIK